jgi:hypothetical protein
LDLQAEDFNDFISPMKKPPLKCMKEYRCMRDVECFLEANKLHRVQLSCYNQPETILSFRHGCFLLGVKYWTETDVVGLEPPMNQRRFLVWKAEKRILTGGRPEKAPVKIGLNVTAAMQVFRDFLSDETAAVGKVEIESTSIVLKHRDMVEKVADDILAYLKRI